MTLFYERQSQTVTKAVDICTRRTNRAVLRAHLQAWSAACSSAADVLKKILQVRERDTAFPCASAAILPKANAFACGAAAHHSPCSKHRLCSNTMALITSYLMALLAALQNWQNKKKERQRCEAAFNYWARVVLGARFR